jgi:hypothetical protein
MQRASGDEKCIQILFGKLEGKRPLGRPTHRKKDNVKNNHRETGLEVWIGFIRHSTGTGGVLLLIHD